MDDKILITEEVAEEMMSFIKPRKNVPDDAESVIVDAIKNKYKRQILGKFIKKDKISHFVEMFKKCHAASVMQPGEAIGIICGQCIGEKTTQGSLNNFHSAGLDTGSTTQIDSLQSITNASKTKKKEKYFKATLKTIRETQDLRELKEKTVHLLEEVKFSDIILNVEKSTDVSDALKILGSPFSPKEILTKVAVVRLDLEKIFTYRISRKILLEKCSLATDAYCLPYSLLDENEKILKLFIFYENSEIFPKIKKLRNIKIVGVDGVKNHVFVQENDGNWKIECASKDVSKFFVHETVYDVNKINCSSVNEIFNTYGILATYEMIIKKCQEIIPEIDECHFKLLADKMTKNGVLEPLNRYTMRNNNSPLAKASFEESFETFLKAAKFKEVEKFKSTSSAIICGKKPRLGTYQFDVLVDPKFYNL